MARGESLVRQWRLLKCLQARRFGVGTEELASELACSKRQVQRDLGILGQVGFPINFEERDFGKKFWKLSPAFIERDELMLSVTEILSLYLARELLAPLSGTQFGEGLGSALEKFKALLPKRTLDYFADLDETLLVKSIAGHDYQGQDKEIRILNQAISEGRELRIRYRSASKGRTTDARYHPYGLIFFGTNLYVVGHHVEYGEVRQAEGLAAPGRRAHGQAVRAAGRLLAEGVHGRQLRHLLARPPPGGRGPIHRLGRNERPRTLLAHEPADRQGLRPDGRRPVRSLGHDGVPAVAPRVRAMRRCGEARVPARRDAGRVLRGLCGVLGEGARRQ